MAMWDKLIHFCPLYIRLCLSKVLTALSLGSDLQSYCSGLIDTGFSRIPKSDGLMEELPYRGSPQEHTRLLNISKGVIKELAKSPIIQNMAGPTLLYPDLHKRNIFCSGITLYKADRRGSAYLTWPSVRKSLFIKPRLSDIRVPVLGTAVRSDTETLEPAFVYATETPDFVEDPAADLPIFEKLMSLGSDPANTEMPEGVLVENTEEERAMGRHEKDVLTCRKTFGVVLQGYMRKLHAARAMDHALLRPFRYCDASWRDGATAIRQEIIDLSQRWTDLGLSGSCEYQPTPEELSENAKHDEDFQTVQRLKIIIKHVLGVDFDGWVPTDRWEESKEEHRNLFCQWLESSRESGGSEDRAKKLWPFDGTGI